MSYSHPNPNISTSQDQMWCVGTTPPPQSPPSAPSAQTSLEPHLSPMSGSFETRLPDRAHRRYRFHNTWPVQVPLSVQMPGTPRSDEGVAATAPATEMTTLSNGVRVISERSSSIGASMAIYFATGSRMETETTAGSSHFMQHLAFKATHAKSHFIMTREIEKLGGHAVSGASRDCIAYAGECLSSKADGLFSLMAETALTPRLEDHDMDAARNLVMHDITNSAKNGPAVVLDAMHSVAYGGRGIGASLLCPAQLAQVLSLRRIPPLNPDVPSSHPSTLLFLGQPNFSSTPPPR